MKGGPIPHFQSPSRTILLLVIRYKKKRKCDISIQVVVFLQRKTYRSLFAPRHSWSPSCTSRQLWQRQLRMHLHHRRQEHRRAGEADPRGQRDFFLEHGACSRKKWKKSVPIFFWEKVLSEIDGMKVSHNLGFGNFDRIFPWQTVNFLIWQVALSRLE